MNTSMRIRQIILLGFLALLAGTASGAQLAGERYIVILRSRSGPAPDVVRLGGTIDFRQEDQLNVTMPREAVAALRADPLVRYIQALAGASDAALVGEPEEPAPGAPRRLVPHATAGNQNWSRSYSYDDAGNITNIGSQQFVYDELGRLKEMATSGTMTEQYGYDRYGNQTSRNSGGVMQTIATEPATNRLSTGYMYDSAGNVISGDGYTLSYDALGQAAAKTYTDTTTATTFNETYIYTAGEERVGVQASNSRETSSWLYWSVRDEGGKVLRQYRSSALDPAQTALWIEDYVYRDGLLVGAERPPTLGGRRHFHLDHLGSPRLITSNDGQLVSMHDYLPFGGESTSVWQETGAGFDREDPMKFTGHERDYAGSFGREDGHGIDYMHARYYSPSVGRVFSADPNLSIAKAMPSPQRWNRYAYVSNNPLKLLDPDGREQVTFADKRTEILFSRLEARYARVHQTLNRYRGAGTPDLLIQRGSAGVDIDGKTRATGVFNAKIEPNYDTAKIVSTGAPQDDRSLLPATGKFISGSKIESATLTIDTSQTPGSKQETQTALHELGHAESAASNPDSYLARGADDVIKPKGQLLPHDERPLEREANDYRDHPEQSPPL